MLHRVAALHLGFCSRACRPCRVSFRHLFAMLIAVENRHSRYGAIRSSISGLHYHIRLLFHIKAFLCAAFIEVTSQLIHLKRANKSSPFICGFALRFSPLILAFRPLRQCISITLSLNHLFSQYASSGEANVGIYIVYSCRLPAAKHLLLAIVWTAIKNWCLPRHRSYLAKS